jgi:hypothetical protein
MKKKGILIGIIIAMAILFVGTFSYNTINSDVRKAKRVAAKYLNAFYTIEDCNKYGDTIMFKELNSLYENLEEFCTEDFMKELLNNRFILLPYKRAHVIQVTSNIKELEIEVMNVYEDSSEIVFEYTCKLQDILLENNNVEEQEYKGQIALKKIDDSWKVYYCIGIDDTRKFYEPILKHVQEEYGD